MRAPLLHETLRQWNIKFAPLLTEELRHREPRRGCRWFLDEVCVELSSRKHWLWRAVDESGAVQGIMLQPHRNSDAAKTFFERLLVNDDVPDVIHTDKLWSYGAAIRALPVLHAVEHIQVISSARCNNLIEQRAGVLKGRSGMPRRVCSRRQSVLPKTVSPAHPESGAKSARLQETTTGTGISDPARPGFEPPPAHPHD